MISRMTLPSFRYEMPESLEEALELLERYGDRARVKAGGTDLLIRMRKRLLTPELLVGLCRIRELDVLAFDPDRGLTIGAGVSLNRVAGDEDVRKWYPAVAYAASVTATPQVRNLGTVVGNLCNAAPSADNAPCLMAYGGEVELARRESRRTVPLASFFQGPGMTVREPEELAVSVRVPPPPPHTGSSYQHLSMRSQVDISAVAVGAVITLEGKICVRAGVVLGAVAPVPLPARKTEELLVGKSLSPDLLERAAQAAMEEACPITDCRACDAYRRRMVGVLTRRAVENAWKAAERENLQ